MIGAGARWLVLAAALLVVGCSVHDRSTGSATGASNNLATPADIGGTPQSAPVPPAIAPPAQPLPAPPPAKSPATPADARSLAEATAASEPMPVRRAIPAEPTASADKPEVLNDRCNSDADCAVKDVGSCCGYRPACLNRDSPTFADAVKARCKAEGRSGICGTIAVPGCQCTNGRCGTRTIDNGVLVQ
ncbi:hypothetical protein BH11PSE14_BH11PSE14_21250 [soil metagenome]